MEYHSVLKMHAIAFLYEKWMKFNIMLNEICHRETAT